MDAIILQDIEFHPTLRIPDTYRRAVAKLQQDGTALGETNVAGRNVARDIWHLQGTFVLPAAAGILSIDIFTVDTIQGELSWGTAQVDVSVIHQNSDATRYQSITVQSYMGEAHIADIKFTTILSTSNYSAKTAPLAVINVAKNLDTEGITELLTQIVTSQVSSTNADVALLNAIHGVVVGLPDDPVEKPRAFTLLANIYVLRYDVYLQIAEERAFSVPMYAIYKNGLQRALSLLEKADRIAQEDHPKRLWIMFSLSLCLQRLIVEPMDNSRHVSQLVDVTLRMPDGEPDKLRLLQFLLDIQEEQFLDTKIRADLESSITTLEHLIRITTDEEAKNPFCVKLNTLLELRIPLLDLATDIAESLKRRFEVLQLVSDTHPGKPVLLNHLGHAYLSQAQTLSNVDLARNSIEVYGYVISLIDDTHPEKASILNNLAASLELRGKLLGITDDSVEIRKALEGAVQCCPPDDPNRMSYLVNLGTHLRPDALRGDDSETIARLHSLFDNTLAAASNSTASQLADLGQLVYSFFILQSALKESYDIRGLLPRFEEIVRVVPEDHQIKPALLYQLASFVACIPDPDSKRANLDRAISLFTDAARLRKKTELFEPVNQGLAYLSRFDISGEFEDLQDGISILEEWHNRHSFYAEPQMMSALDALTCSLLTRFNICNYNLNDLLGAVSVIEDAAYVAHRSEERNRDRKKIMDYFAEHLQQFSDVSDLDVITKAMNKEVRLICDTQSAERSPLLESLGMYLAMRLKGMSDSKSIPHAVLSNLASDVQSLPDVYPKKALWLNMIGDLLVRSSSPTDDLELAVSMFSHAVALTPGGRDPYSDAANHLGCAFLRRYRARGNLADINSAVNVFDDALENDTHAKDMRHTLLTNLSVSLLDRYFRLRDISDFNRSCHAVSEARELSSEVEDAAVINSNIALMLTERATLAGGIEDVNEAIAIYAAQSQNLALKEPSILRNYASSLLRRFRITNSVQDVDLALELLDKALQMADGIGSSEKAATIHAQSMAFSQRFVRLAMHDDLDKCIAALRNAEALTDERHTFKAQVQFDLGRWLPVRFGYGGNAQDIDDAFAYLEASASSASSPSQQRFHAASLWAHWIKYFHRGNAMVAYSLSMKIIPTLAWLGLSIPNRHHLLLEAGEVLVDAVAAAIDEGQLGTAVEWLEMGRGIVWSQLLELRKPLHALRAAHPDLADQLQSLSEQLDSPDLHVHMQTTSSTAPTRRYHDLALERDQLIKTIRQMEGFSEFLQPPKLSELFFAARSGPVVTINLSQYRCDALALMPNSKIIHIPLEQFSAADASKLSDTLRGLLRQRNALSVEERGRARLGPSKRRVTDPEVQFEEILAKLWTCLAKPILDGLDIKTPSTHLPRVWWCLTGSLAFLPIHAAGMYRKRDGLGSKLSDFVISSYIPSVSSLLRSSGANTSLHRQIMVVGLPDESELPQVTKEIDNITNSLRDYPILRLLDSEATVTNVVEGMKTSSYVHFACHGIQDPTAPTDSALLLAGSTRLTLSAIANLNLAHCELAFLSACQTATGDDLVTNESVHLTAGMLISGYRSVIGTLWSISDADAPLIAKTVYDLLYNGHDNLIDASQAAYALDQAVKFFRDGNTGKKSFFSWVPFVHFGM